MLIKSRRVLLLTWAQLRNFLLLLRLAAPFSVVDLGLCERHVLVALLVRRRIAAGILQGDVLDALVVRAATRQVDAIVCRCPLASELLVAQVARAIHVLPAIELVFIHQIWLDCELSRFCGVGPGCEVLRLKLTRLHHRHIIIELEALEFILSLDVRGRRPLRCLLAQDGISVWKRLLLAAHFRFRKFHGPRLRRDHRPRKWHGILLLLDQAMQK